MMSKFVIEKAGANMRRFLGKLGMTVLLLSPVVLSAQSGNGVQVSTLNVSNGTVTFNVSWENTGMPAVWSDTVWVFVDYNNAGTMTRLPLAPGATLTVTSAPDVGKVEQLAGNHTGVRVIGNARSAGNFSATVKLLTATADVSGACAYAVNYPPVAAYTTAETVKFTGTPGYNLVLKHTEGGTINATSGGTYQLPPGYTVDSFTDKTGAPGIVKCISPATYNLIASASGFCTGGAGVKFTLSGTQNGVGYQLYRNNSAVGGATFTGTGGAATFSSTFNVAGTYTAHTLSGAYCSAVMSGAPVITENAIPATPSISHNGPQCEGTAVRFTASGGSGSYDWSCSGFSCSGSGSYKDSPTAAGEYTAQVRSYTTSSGTTCYSGTASTTGTVVANPGAPSMSGGGSQCGGSRTIYAYAGSGGTGIRWTDNNSTSTSRSATVTGTYYAVTTNSAGCESGTNSVSVTIASAPGAPSMSGGGSQCGGSRTIYANAGSGGTGIRWTDNNSTSTSRSATVTGTYYAVTTNSAGCESGTNSVSVTITNPPSAPLLDRSAASTCTGASIKFTASGGNSYAWSCSGFTCSGSGSSQTTPTSAGNYSATVYAVSGSCQSSSGATQSATIIAPAASGNAPNTCGCASGLKECSGSCQANCDAVENCSLATTTVYQCQIPKQVPQGCPLPVCGYDGDTAADKCAGYAYWCLETIGPCNIEGNIAYRVKCGN